MKSKNRLRTLLCIVLFLNFTLIHSQSNTSSIGLTGGYAQEGFGAKISYNYYNNPSDFIQASILTTFSNEKVNQGIDIPYNIYSLNLGYYTTLLKTRNNNITLSIGGGASAGYESVNNGKDNLSDNSLLLSESKFIYGAFTGLDIDIYLSENFSFLIQPDLFYHFGSDLGNFNVFAGAGFRYFLN